MCAEQGQRLSSMPHPPPPPPPLLLQIGKRPVGRNQLPPSYEGTQQRCFKSMYVCLHDINTRTWQLHEYGQMLVRHYGGDALVLAMPQTQPPGQQGSTLLPPPVSVLKQLNKAPKGGSQKAAAAAEQVVRVVFQKRGGDPRLLTDRQLINSKELVERCNAWRYTAPSGARVRALCWEVRALRGCCPLPARSMLLGGLEMAAVASAFLCMLLSYQPCPCCLACPLRLS